MQVPILKSTFQVLMDKINETKKDIDENSKDIGKAAALGDLKENSAYHSAKERQILLLERMQRLKSYQNCRIIDLSDKSPDRVSFGTSVTVVNKETSESNIYNLIGPAEFELELMSDMATITAPMARLLMGKQVGETVEVKFGNNQWTGEITEIRGLA
ncbi:MAG: GreA/GreB family elongation factor [bacterium]